MAEDQKPADPVTENQNILMMKPVKAFPYQDHQAHIAVHMAAMQDPKIVALLQNNPQAPQLQAAMMAHINEHIGFQYRVDIEKQMGMVLPAQKVNDLGEEEETTMTPQEEAQLAPMIAQAAQKLLMMNQQQAKQQQAQKQAQDPIIQMQMQELQIKAQEQQRKTQKDQTDAQLKMQQLQLEAKRIESQGKIAAGNMMAKSAMDNQKLKSQRIKDGANLMADMMKNHQIQQETNKRTSGQAVINAAMKEQEHQHNKEIQSSKPKKETK